MKFGSIEIGRQAACVNCGRTTTQWITLGNASAPTCDQCKREVTAAIRETAGFNQDGRNYGPHEQYGDD